MTHSSDIAGRSSWSSEPAHADDPLDAKHRQVFDDLLADMGKAESLESLREAYGVALGYGLCLLQCRVVDVDQRAALDRAVRAALLRCMNAISPLDDELVL